MNINSRSHKINKTYICLDCIFTFTIHAEKDSFKYTFCPNCGENINVEKLKNKKTIPKKFWEDWEIELIDRIINGEIKVYQVAYKTNRTEKSVRNRMIRRREELNI